MTPAALKLILIQKENKKKKVVILLADEVRGPYTVQLGPGYQLFDYILM